MSTISGWDPPSPRVAEMIRAGAQAALGDPEEIFAEVDAATLADNPAAADPVLAAAVRRSNRANLVHWAEANIRDPGAPVPPNLSPETLALARDIVRRGLDAEALQSYRLGQNIVWRRWMTLVFALTSDPTELRELLDVSARSIFSFVDATLAAIAQQMQRERDELTRGTHAERREVVSLIIEGAPISPRRAVARLGYDLGRSHTAAIVWADEPGAEASGLEEAAEAVGRAAGSRPLKVLASERAIWVWVNGSAGPDPARLRDALADLPAVRVALGPTAPGIKGFRRSHLDALATQRLMYRASSQLRLASYDDVQLVALTIHDEERAAEFVRRTLGEFAGAPAELHETARVYLRERYNATRTAQILFTHRNTILARLARIEQLLPAPLDGRGLHVALALEILRWRGT